MPVNECVPLYRGGAADLTGHVASPVTGKRFVRVSAALQAGPALNASTTGGNVQIAPATAAGAVFGVAAYDGAAGDKIPVIREGNTVPVIAAGAIAAGAGVEVGTGAKAVTLASGVRVGTAVSASSADGDEIYVKLGV